MAGRRRETMRSLATDDGIAKGQRLRWRDIYITSAAAAMRTVARDLLGVGATMLNIGGRDARR